MSKRLTIAVIAGDGIGREVTAEAVKVMEAATRGHDIRLEPFELGIEHYLETGEMLSDETLARISRTDAILFGAVGGVPGDPRLAGVSVERDLLLKLRFAFDQYVNLRPTVIRAETGSPLGPDAEADFVIVREGTEGAYSGNGGVVRGGTEHAIATEVSVNTHRGVRRVVEYAARLAESRDGRLTVVHKNNVLIHAGALWSEVQREVEREHPDVAFDYLHVDAATIHLVQHPERFDVIVTDNLFGDILTDLAGAIGGGIGLAASGNINPDGAFPSMFEPVHGSAPDIAGQGIADPTAAIVSMAMMLEQLELVDEAAAVRRAVESTLGHGPLRTTEVGDLVVSALAQG